MRFFSRLTDDKRLLFFCFWLSVMAVYLPSYKAGFIADFLGMYPTIRDGSFIDFINRKTAHVRSLYQVTQIQLYVFIKLFGTHFVPWFLLITGLHALNGVLAYRFFSRLFGAFQLTRGKLIALTGTLLFLFNPNITEVTIWKGGYHYLTGVMMQLLVLICCQHYIGGGKKKYAWYAAILFAVSLFTLEIFYVTPFLTLFLLTGYYLKKGTKAAYKKGLALFFLPQTVLFLVHLVLFRVCYGSWIAHYGTISTTGLNATELLSGLKDTLPRAGKYLAYILAMAGHYPERWRLETYSFLSAPAIYYSIVILLFTAVFFTFARFKKINPALQIACFLLAAVLCCLVLIVPIYFDDLFSAYNSRRCYQPGLFLYMLAALFIFSAIKNLRVAVVVYGLYLLICLLLTFNMVWRWRTAAKVQYGILRSFTWQHSDPVLLLNVPDYYGDVRIMSVSEGNEFNEQLRIFGYNSVRGRLYGVSSYNMKNPWDGAHVTVMDSMTIKVTLNQWGSWWMYNYLGASDYETALYEVRITDPGHEYILKLKQRPAGMAILFVQDIYWRKVDMDKPGEQW